MLDKKQCQIFIVSKILQGRGETHSHILNHLSGQIRALVAVISGTPAPFNDFLPDLLEMADIPYTDYGNGDFGFELSWLEQMGFDLSDPQNPRHPKYDENW